MDGNPGVCFSFARFSNNFFMAASRQSQHAAQPQQRGEGGHGGSAGSGGVVGGVARRQSTRAKRHARWGPGPVVVCLPSGERSVMSVDGADELKIVVWGDLSTGPAVARLRAGLLESMAHRARWLTLLRVRGGREQRRLEMVFRTVAQRDAALAQLRAARASMRLRCRVAIGRTYARRVADRSRNVAAVPAAGTRASEPLAANNRLQVAVLNANGVRPKEVELALAMRDLGLHVLGVAETHVGADRSDVRSKHFVWFGRNVDERNNPRNRGGVALCVEPMLARAAVRLADPSFANSLWVKLRKGAAFRSATGKSLVLATDVFVGVAYLKPSLNLRQAKEAIAEWEARINEYRARGLVVLLGDFNVKFSQFSGAEPAWPGDVRPVPVCGPHAVLVAQPRSRDKAFAAMLRRVEMVSLHGWRRGVSETSWHQPPRAASLTDYIVIPRAMLASQHTLVVHHNLDLGSDHSLLQSGLEALSRVAAGARDPVQSRAVRGVRREGGASEHRASAWSARRLTDPAIRQRYAQSVDRAFAGYRTDADASADETFADFARRLERAARPILGGVRAHSRALPRWFDGEMQRLVKARRAAWSQVRAKLAGAACVAEVGAVYASYGLLAKKVKAAAWGKKRVAWRALQDELNAQSLDDPHAFWRFVKTFVSVGRPSRVTGPIRDSASGVLVHSGPAYLRAWQSYFATLGNAPFVLNGRAVPFTELPPRPAVADDVGPAELEAEFTEAEVDAAVKRAKLGKAGGPDGWKPEMLRYACIVPQLTRLFNHIREREEIPSAWGLGTIIALPKRGDLADPANYRGITLLGVVAKTFGSTLANRLEMYLESGGHLSAAQNGFRSGRGCMDNLYTLSVALTECKAAGQAYTVAFLDIKKAFDRVWRDGLWHKLRSLYNVTGKFARLLEKSYDVHQARVQINGEYSDVFDVTVGTKQGATESPLLFAVFINDLATELEASGRGLNLPLTKRMLTCLLLADDLALFAPSNDDMQWLLSVCTRWAKKWRLEFGVHKCGVLHPRDANGTLVRVADLSTLRLQEQDVAWVPTYRYLGLVVRHDADWCDTIADRRSATTRALGGVHDTLVMRNLALSAKISIVRAMIVPVALYGCELWCNGRSSAAPVAQVVDRALRLVFRATRNSNAGVAYVEAGILPLHMMALKRRLGALAKWSSDGAPEWPSWILGRGDRGLGGRQSWRSQTISFAKRYGWSVVQDAPVRAADAGMPLETVLRAAALTELRAKAQVGRGQPTVVRYLADYAGDYTAEGQPYMRGRESVRQDQFGACQLFRLRAGSTTLGKYLHMRRTPGVVSPNCLLCPQRTRRAAPEDRNHFVLYCPALRSQREEWTDAIKAELGADLFQALVRLRRHLTDDEKTVLLLGGSIAARTTAAQRRDHERLLDARAALQRTACAGVGALARERLKQLKPQQRPHA